MDKKKYLVTGGTGFIGAALVRRLVSTGAEVRVLDNLSRSQASRLDDLKGKIEFVCADVRDASAVAKAAKGVDSICHLAFVNGTEFFYTKPELVLDVGVRGMLNVMDACRVHKVPELILASSSEVYQSASKVPTDETVPLSIPDPRNPRYSYAGGKIISELLALHGASKVCRRVIIFRPHNVYGPAMGYEHVLPQFILRMKELSAQNLSGKICFPIQGTGDETRAFVSIDDFTDGLMLVIQKGEHLGIYHIGTIEEVSMRYAALAVAGCFGRQIEIVPDTSKAPGGTKRRCPDISRLVSLGYCPKYKLKDGIGPMVEWYLKNPKP